MHVKNILLSLVYKGNSLFWKKLKTYSKLKPTANILFHGKSGTRQECPLSTKIPLLNILLKVIVSTVDQEKQVKNVSIEKSTNVIVSQ